MADEIVSDTSWRFNIEPQHLSNSTKTIGKDIDLVRRMCWEAMLQVGIRVRYFKCTASDNDFYQDPECTWENEVFIDGIFEEIPKVKVLKELGWYSEDEEIRPQILYLPIYSDWTTKTIFDVKENSLIQISYFGQTAPAEFRITDRKMDSVYGCYYICKLAPERLDNFVMVQNEGSYYLKRDPNRTDLCEHGDAIEVIKDANGGVVPDTRVYNHSNYDDYNSIIMEG